MQVTQSAHVTSMRESYIGARCMWVWSGQGSSKFHSPPTWNLLGVGM